MPLELPLGVPHDLLPAKARRGSFPEPYAGYFASGCWCLAFSIIVGLSIYLYQEQAPHRLREARCFLLTLVRAGLVALLAVAFPSAGA